MSRSRIKQDQSQMHQEVQQLCELLLQEERRAMLQARLDNKVDLELRDILHKGRQGLNLIKDRVCWGYAYVTWLSMACWTKEVFVRY